MRAGLVDNSNFFFFFGLIEPRSQTKQEKSRLVAEIATLKRKIVTLQVTLI